MVYISGLPPYASAEDLRTIMARAGTVVDVDLPLDFPSRRHRGLAFCYYTDAQSAHNAVTIFNDYPLEDAHGSRLRVRLAPFD